MKDFKLRVYFFGLPFLVGAIFEFVGAWAGWPALLVCGVLWLGTIVLLGEKKTDWQSIETAPNSAPMDSTTL